MDCSEFLDRYSDYDDSLVRAAEIDRFRAHLSTCEACARYDRVLRKGRMLARQIPAPEPARDFVPLLHKRLWLENGQSARRAARLSQLAAALPAVTVVLALTVAVALLGDKPGYGAHALGDVVENEVVDDRAVAGNQGPRGAESTGSAVSTSWAADATQERQPTQAPLSRPMSTGASLATYTGGVTGTYTGGVTGASAGGATEASTGAVLASGAVANGVVWDPVDGHPSEVHRAAPRPGRMVSLPPVQLASAAAEPRGWASGRVDREPLGSYSPLTMGPPAYGVARSR